MCSHRPTYSTDLLETWATTRSVIMIQRRVMIASNDSRMAVWDQLARLVTFTVCSQTILSRISKSSQDIAHNSPFYVVCPPWLMKMTLVVWAASRDPQRRTGLILTTQQYNSVGLLTGRVNECVAGRDARCHMDRCVPVRCYAWRNAHHYDYRTVCATADVNCAILR